MIQNTGLKDEYMGSAKCVCRCNLSIHGSTTCRFNPLWILESLFRYLQRRKKQQFLPSCGETAWFPSFCRVKIALMTHLGIYGVPSSSHGCPRIYNYIAFSHQMGRNVNTQSYQNIQPLDGAECNYNYIHLYVVAVCCNSSI